MSESRNRRERRKLEATPVKLMLLPPASSSQPNSVSRNLRKAAIDNRIGGSTNSTKPVASKKSQLSKPTKGTKNKRSVTTKSSVLSTKKLLQDPVKSIKSIREFCQQCLGYVQQADTLLDQLQGTAKSLHEAGILQKLVETKGKNLDTSELTTLLFALMNTPLGSTLLQKFGGGKKDTPTS